MKKSNITGTLFLPHDAVVTLLRKVKQDADAPRNLLFTLCVVITSTDFAEAKIPGIIDELEKAAQRAGVRAADWIENTITSLQRQADVSPKTKGFHYKPLHQSTVTALNSIITKEQGDDFKALVQLVGMIDIPGEHIGSVHAVITVKTEQLGIQHAEELTAILADLERRIPDASTVDAEVATQQMHNSVDHMDESGATETTAAA